MCPPAVRVTSQSERRPPSHRDWELTVKQTVPTDVLHLRVVDLDSKGTSGVESGRVASRLHVFLFRGIPCHLPKRCHGAVEGIEMTTVSQNKYALCSIPHGEIAARLWCVGHLGLLCKIRP